MIWHVLVVEPQTEFRVQSKLITRGIRAMAPVRRLERARERKPPAIVRVPMLPGYVMAGFDADADWHDLHHIDGLRGFLHMAGDPDRPAALTRADIARVEMMATPTVDDAPRPKVAIGDRVKVRRGHLADLAAIVDGLGEDRVTLLVDLLGRRHRVTVPISQIGDAA